MGPYQNVLLIGASGAMGGPVTAELLKSSYKVSILTRAESKSKFPDDVPVFRADYKNLSSVTAAMKGQDVVISMVGGEVIGDQQVFIDAAVAAGVKRFFPSEFGPYNPDPRWHKINPYVPPAKTTTAEVLRSLEPKMSWTAVVTGAFFDWGLETGFFGMDIPTKTATLIDGGTSVFTSTTLPAIGRAIIAILDQAEKTANTYVIISSFNISQKDLLEVVEKVDGQKWTIKHVTSEEVNANGHKSLAEGDFNGIKDLTRSAAFGKQGLGDERFRGMWNDKLGLPADDIEEEVRRVLKR